MGGTDDPENIIELTAEEHAEAHRLLYEQYGKKEDYVAWKGLARQIGREEFFIKTSSIGGSNNKDKPKSKIHKQKISEANKGKKSHWRNGDIEGKKKKLSQSMKGNTNSKNHSSAEYKKKHSEIMKKSWAERKLKSKK